MASHTGHLGGISTIFLCMQNILSIDSQEENINKAKKAFSQVFEADTTQRQVLEQIGLSDMKKDCRIVALFCGIATRGMDGGAG